MTACTLVVTISSPIDFADTELPWGSSTVIVTSHNAVAPPEIDANP